MVLNEKLNNLALTLKKKAQTMDSPLEVGRRTYPGILTHSHLQSQGFYWDNCWYTWPQWKPKHWPPQTWAQAMMSNWFLDHKHRKKEQLNSCCCCSWLTLYSLDLSEAFLFKSLSLSLSLLDQKTQSHPQSKVSIFLHKKGVL